MKPSVWKKQPWEERVLNIDCTNALPTGVTVASVDPEIYDDEGTDVSADMIDTSSVSSPSVIITIKGGTDGEVYDLKIKITLSNGEQVEDDLKIKVREQGQ